MWEILTLLPPLIAIIVAMWQREVILALLVALWTSETLLAFYNPALGFIASFERQIAVLGDDGSARILMFSLLVGALLAFIRDSGGVSAFVQWLSHRGLARSPRQVGLLTSLTGVAIFIETNLSVLTAGILSRSLFDRFRMSRERLAYIIDSTCAPVSVLLLFNAWGAFLLGLIEPYQGDNAVATLAWAVPLNFYALLTLAGVFYTVISNRVFGPMAHTERDLKETPLEQQPAPTKVRYMLLPLATMIVGIIALMVYTGKGDLFAGSGSRSVLWATATAVLVGYLLLRFDLRQPHREIVHSAFKGMGKLLPLVATVLLALALGASLRELGTGDYVARLVGDNLPVLLIAPLVFIAACIISFTTGTSWGTFGLMVPIAMPLAVQLGIPAELLLAAVIGGGVFGDHCSPISDTTIVSSLAAGCDHLDHVKTQLPYALTTGGVSILLYLLAGLFI